VTLQICQQILYEPPKYLKQTTTTTPTLEGKIFQKSHFWWALPVQ